MQFNIEIIAIFLAMPALISVIVAGLVIKVAHKKKIFDLPNNRSAHSSAIPTAGGVAIYLAVCLTLFVAYRFDFVTLNLLLSLVGSVTIISVIGLYDDLNKAKVLLRLAAQFLAVLWGLSWVGIIEKLQTEGFNLSLIVIIILGIVLSLVWVVNLYNFMDGIDGIASLQAITVLLGAIIIHLINTSQIDPIMLIVMSSIFGFLYWNFPKAKLFMGDTGSGFLGIFIGLYTIILMMQDFLLGISVVVLMSIFFVDTGITLIRRFYRGEKIYAAHNYHGYQHAARRYKSHFKVSTMVALYNLVILFPLALGMNANLYPWWLCLIIALTITGFWALVFKSGERFSSH